MARIRVNSLHDLSISLVESPTSLTPGIPILVTVEVTNSGNGEETAILDLPWSSDSWNWWALIDGANVTDGIPLSVSYDLENVKMVDVWIILPSLEALESSMKSQSQSTHRRARHQSIRQYCNVRGDN